MEWEADDAKASPASPRTWIGADAASRVHEYETLGALRRLVSLVAASAAATAATAATTAVAAAISTAAATTIATAAAATTVATATSAGRRLEAVAAVDGTVTAGLEGDLGILAAGRAGDRPFHFPLGACS